jgi:hypothetical protein
MAPKLSSAAANQLLAGILWFTFIFQAKKASIHFAELTIKLVLHSRRG